MNGDIGPILGPYMRAMALAEQIRAARASEEERKLRTQDREQSIKLHEAQLQRQAKQDERQATLDALDLASKGIRPWTNKGVGVTDLMARLFTPGHIVKTPQGDFEVPTEEQEDARALKRLERQERGKHDISGQFDPEMELALSSDMQQRLGVPTIRARRSEIFKILPSLTRTTSEAPFVAALTDPTTNEAIIAGVNRRTGEPVFKTTIAGAIRTSPSTTQTKPTEGELKAQAEESVMKKWGLRSVEIENPEWRAIMERKKQQYIEDGELPNTAEGWVQAEQRAAKEIAGSRLFKGISATVDIRRKPDFQAAINAEYARLAAESRATRLKSSTRVVKKEIPASQVPRRAKEMNMSVTEFRRNLALDGWTILENQ